MQSIKWLAFAVKSAVTDTYVHFFPCAGNVSAPYPVSCKFTCFSDGHRSQTITVEGARLSQPDGIKFSDLFKDVTTPDCPVGLEIVLTSLQPRIDLSASRCIVEIASHGNSARYVPQQVGENLHGMRAPGIAVSDSLGTTELISLNGGAEKVSVNLSGGACAAVQTTSGASDAKPAVPESQRARNIDALSVSKVSIDKSFFENAAGVDQSGKIRERCVQAVGIEPVASESDLTACFLLYRDATTKVPLSVMAI